MKIIIAEDDQLHRSLLETMLIRNGHEVVSCDDGRPCQAMLAREPFDLLITDLFMPGMDGVQLVVALRGRGHTLPIIGMTGGYSKMVRPYMNSMLRLGVDAVLLKPFSEKELLDVIASTGSRLDRAAVFEAS